MNRLEATGHGNLSSQLLLLLSPTHVAVLAELCVLRAWENHWPLRRTPCIEKYVTFLGWMAQWETRSLIISSVCLTFPMRSYISVTTILHEGLAECFHCFLKCEVAFGNSLYMESSAVDFCFILKCEELFCPLMKQSVFGECFCWNTGEFQLNIFWEVNFQFLQNKNNSLAAIIVLCSVRLPSLRERCRPGEMTVVTNMLDPGEWEWCFPVVLTGWFEKFPKGTWSR